MASLNKVMLLGRLGQDPELKYTQNQNAVVNFSLATSEFRNDREGQRQEVTEWHRVTVWGRTAENCQKFLRKGSLAYVEGRLQTRSWEDQSGSKRYSTEIVAQNIQFLSSRGHDNNAQLGSFSDPLGSHSSGNDSSNPLGDMSDFPPPPSAHSPKSVSGDHFDDMPF